MQTLLRLEGVQTVVGGPYHLGLDGGTATVLQGPSGSGKSLLLRAIADLDPHLGTCVLEDVPAHALTGWAWRRRVVYLAAEPAWWAATAAEHGLARDDPRLDALDLGPQLLDRPLDHCSVGERQRLALVRALAGAPTVLLADEPTANLDPERCALVVDLLRAWVQAGVRAVLATCHDPGTARRLGDRRLRLDANRQLHEEGA